MSAACNCCAWGIVLLQLYDAATTYTPCPCLMLCCPPRAGKRDTLAGLRPGSSKMSMAMGSGMRHLHETAGAHQSCWVRADLLPNLCVLEVVATPGLPPVHSHTNHLPCCRGPEQRGG